MFGEHRTQIVRYGLVVLTAVAVGGVYFKSHNSDSSKEGKGDASLSPAEISVKSATGDKVGVHVAGEVRNPGVYWLKSGSRVGDAIEKAGGVKPTAEIGTTNLAAKVEDGRQILVPKKTETGRGNQQPNSPNRGMASTNGSQGGVASNEIGGKQPLNLNTASLEQLQELDGVGPATARKIFDYRQQHGGFTRVDELGQIAGIGEKKLETLRAQVTV